MDSGERELLTSTINELVASVDGTELTAELDSFGWSDLLASSPDVAIAATFSALGRSNHWSSAFQDVIARNIADGPLSVDRQSAVVVPWPRRTVPGIVTDDTLSVRGLMFQPRPLDSLIVPAQSKNGVDAVLLVTATDFVLESRLGLDPSLGTVAVSGTSNKYRVLVEGSDAAAWWSETVAFARVSLCYSLVASLKYMVELAVEHATSRYQFGRPIGAFQAVRHRAAESLVAYESAVALVDEVWRSDNFELAAATAKLVTSNAAKVVTAHVQQILAGIGFTTEHEFHRYMKRAVALDRLFDNSTDLAGFIGRELVTLGSAPRLFEL